MDTLESCYRLNTALLTPPTSPIKCPSLLFSPFKDQDFPLSTTPPISPRKSKRYTLSAGIEPRHVSLAHLRTPLKSRENLRHASLSMLTPPASPERKQHIRSRSDALGYAFPLSVAPLEDPFVSEVRQLYLKLPKRSARCDGADDESDEVGIPTLTYSPQSPESVGEHTEDEVIIEDRVASLPATSPADAIRRRRAARGSFSVDLTLPYESAYPPPLPFNLDTPTPSTRAIPAQGAFPFPRQDRITSCLSPLAGRRSSRFLSQNPRSPDTGSPWRPRTASQTPDRFIPVRTSMNDSRDSFQMTKPSEQLTDSEKSARKRRSSLDPFSRHARGSARSSNQHLSFFGPRTPGSLPSNAARHQAMLSLRRGSRTGGNRQISAGAVWNMGGSAAVGDGVAGVSDGRGGLLGSGTNAPLYTSSFLCQPDHTSELEAHEHRVALAFDMDQYTRILAYHTPPENPIPPTRTARNSPARATEDFCRTQECQGPTVWRDNQWTKDGVTTREFL